MAAPNDTENLQPDETDRTDAFSSSGWQAPVQRKPPDSFHPILICMSGAHRGQRFKLENRETIVGRSREVHLQVNDGGTSRRHARIIYENWSRPQETPICHIEDLQSRNGTEVNGELINRVTPLSERDRITIGRTIFGFFLRDKEELLQDESLYENATRDALTGLDNRQQMLSHLKHYMALAARRHIDLCLLLIDVDCFKAINDTHGHQVGDEALRHLARLLTNCSRDTDLVARWGGEEFAVSVPDSSIENAAVFAERLRITVESSPLLVGDEKVRMTVSLGISILQPGDTLRTLFDRADRALYEAKAAGRNRVVVAAHAEVG